MTNGLSHPYHLDESTFTFRGIRGNFLFVDKFPASKQNSPRWDATFCGVTSGVILFAYVHKKGARLIWAKSLNQTIFKDKKMKIQATSKSTRQVLDPSNCAKP